MDFFNVTVLAPEEVPAYLALHARAMRSLPMAVGKEPAPFMGLQLAVPNELGFNDYFYPPFHRMENRCWWIDKFNGEFRIGTYDASDPKELKYFDSNFKVTAHFHKAPENIGSPND